MTKIKFFKRNDQFIGLECSGHTGYAEYNKDVLCASLSGIIQSGILGLNKVLNINGKLNRKDEEGYIKYELPKNLDDKKLLDSQIILMTMYESIKDLCSGYSQYISMEVIEDVY